ncbi:MAG: hypothetical protein U0520_02045 [Candidatus Saccharimonadales bacterium]
MNAETIPTLFSDGRQAHDADPSSTVNIQPKKVGVGLWDPNGKISSAYADLGGGHREALQVNLPPVSPRPTQGAEPLPINRAVDRGRHSVRDYNSDGLPKPEERGDGIPRLTSDERTVSIVGIKAARAALTNG